MKRELRVQRGTIRGVIMIRYSKCYCGKRARTPTPDLGTDSPKEWKQKGTLGIGDNEWHSRPLGLEWDRTKGDK